MPRISVLIPTHEHATTLPYSPYQNGKQEAFWGTLEGRLMKMLDGVADLTLELLNEATQAWVEIEYNRAVHRATFCSPVRRTGGSGGSPAASVPFLTFPSVWNDATWGAPQISLARLPTHPESQ